MFPARLSIMTCNLWNTQRWPLRRDALGRLVTLFRPDILCVQELCEDTRAFLDGALPQHDRVHDDFPGWTCEGNVYWNTEFLGGADHGTEDIGIIEAHRRLFWVRLELLGQRRSILVSTAHLTYKGHPEELRTGMSPRLEQTRRAVDSLDRLAQDGEPVWFMGDFNDPSHPIHILHSAGFRDCFSALGVPAPPTSPCHPTAQRLESGPAPSQTLDWIVSNRHARALAAQVPHVYHGDVAPSDHWPVVAIYEI